MKFVALLAGTALALVPSGTAFAGETGNGKAWGNCKNSSAGGEHAPLQGAAGNGNGGLQAVSSAGGVSADGRCATAVTITPPPPVTGGSYSTVQDG